MDKKQDYGASSIQVLKDLEGVRKKHNLQYLLKESKRYHSISDFAKMIKISRSTLNRALIERKILNIYPDLGKSKTQLINHFRINKELKLFMGYYDIYNLSFRQLKEKIKEWERVIEINPFILVNQLQHDVLIGSLLGDGNARKRYGLSYFRCGHSKKQETYINWKYNLFKEYIKSDIWISEKKNRNNMHVFQTISHKVFNYYYDLFYKKGKKIITKDILNQLNPMSLAIWVCDDGSYCNQQGNITLCTNSFSLKEHKLIKNYFKKSWGLDPTLGFRDNKYYYLRFKKEDSIKLISIIKNFIPIKEMTYKIGEKNE